MIAMELPACMFLSYSWEEAQNTHRSWCCSYSMYSVCVCVCIISRARQNTPNLLSHEVMDYRLINEDKQAADMSEGPR